MSPQKAQVLGETRYESVGAWLSLGTVVTLASKYVSIESIQSIQSVVSVLL